MGQRIILLILITFTAFARADVDLAECDFYFRKSAELGCSSRNYLVNFGGRYCRKFVEKNDRYSLHGQRVLSGIRSCLIRQLEERQYSCETVEEIAFDDHVDCYVENGFCSLGDDDRNQILWTVRRELLNPKFQRTASQIVRLCNQERP